MTAELLIHDGAHFQEKKFFFLAGTGASSSSGTGNKAWVGGGELAVVSTPSRTLHVRQAHMSGQRISSEIGCDTCVLYDQKAKLILWSMINVTVYFVSGSTRGKWTCSTQRKK